MGRAPCCDKANVKRGPWSPEEDAKLKAYIEQHGTGGNWIALPQKIGLKRCGKSCRLRWLNYLRPNIKHGGFTEEEDNIICSLYISIGSRWSIIAAQLPGRTDNDIKNYWNTRLKKKLFGKQRKEQACRGNNQKQEMLRKGREYFVASDHNIDQKPFWPELPVLQPIPYSNEEPRFNNDHASIRKLLMKLGGRFSDDDLPINGDAMNLHYPLDNSLLQASYQQSLDHLLSADHKLHIPSTMVQSLVNTQYNITNGADMSMMPGQSSVAAELGHVLYNNPQNLDGLEFLYGDILNHKSETIPRGSIDWGEMSSLHFTSGASSTEGFQKDQMLHESTFDELRYSMRQ